MPCSLCQNAGHNRRSAICPVNIANQTRTRPSAELRPRTTPTVLQVALAPVGIADVPDTTRPTETPEIPQRLNSSNPEYYRLPHDEQLNAYMLLYKNLRSTRQFEEESGIIYNVYRLLGIPGQPVIPSYYMRSTDNTVILRRIGAMYFTAIGVREGRSLRILNKSPLPDTDELYIFIPQIPGFNIPIIDSVVSAKTVFENHIKQMTYEINEPDNASLPCENTCAVCLDTIQPDHFVHTNCKHGYCAGCIAKHIKTQHTKFQNMPYIPKEMVELPCPLCRTNIDKLVFTQEEQHYLMCVFLSDEILA